MIEQTLDRVTSQQNGTASAPTPAAISQTPVTGGRTVVVLQDKNGERVELRAADGAIEFEMAITESGPVVKLHAGRLEVRTDEDISLQCRRFEVNTSEQTTIKSEGEFRVKAEKDVVMNGEFMRLNCDEDESDTSQPG